MVILVSTLGTTKIRYNLHTGQYASRVPSDHNQGQMLGEPLSLPGVTRHQKFLCKVAQKRDGGLNIRMNGFNCDWLKVVIFKEVIIFLAICSLCCRVAR